MKSSIPRWSLRLVSSLTLVACLSFWAFAQDDDPDPTFTAPVLISEPNSTRALAVPDGVKFLGFGRGQNRAFAVDSRITLFATNLAFMEDEGANSLRISVQDANGRFFRFPVVGLKLYQGTAGPSAIYAITVDVSDAFHFWDLNSVDGDTLVGLTWRGLISNRTRLGINHTGGDIQDDPGSAPTPLNSVHVVNAQKTRTAGKTEDATGFDKFSGNRRRLLEQAAFGPTDALESRIRQIGVKAWLNEQFLMQYPSATNPFPNDPLKAGQGVDLTCDGDNSGLNGNPIDVPTTCSRDTYTMYKPQTWFMREAFYTDAQLRHRVTWALAQIWVNSGVDISQGRHIVEYYKLLSNNAFGNYRNLMKDMTLSPTMGDYLSMSLSTKNSPNENYAREVMQLFSIGLFMLNQDGTLQLDGSGNPIPTYTQDGVNNLTKVFTGWSFCNVAASCPNFVSTSVLDYIDPMLLNGGVTVIGNNKHDLTAKTLLSYPGSTTTNVAACGNCTTLPNVTTYANASMDQALDNLFNHPNVAPFVSKTLIQHMVTSDPTPAYVARVAAVFNNNGTGVRGDMKAVVRAILLDPEARGNVKTDPTYGKLREPVQLTTNFGREFGVRSADGTTQTDGWFPGIGEFNNMAEVPFMSPTVFNFFPPGYVVPGTAFLGTEFAIMNTGTSIARANFMNRMVYTSPAITGGGTNVNFPAGTSFDFSDLQALATADATGNTLVDELNRRMLHGTMTSQMKTTILGSFARITNDANAPLNKVKQAVYLVATSSQYQVQR